MIKPIDFTDENIAQRALVIQHLAYRIEADLIGFDGIPQLHETVDNLRDSDETFVGYFVDNLLVGVISFEIEQTTLDIGRLVVHPDYFKRGIAQQLVAYVEQHPTIDKWIVSTGAKNQPARQLYEKLGYQLTGEITLPEGVVIACYEKLEKPE